jgi:Protein of unknown function (DUF3800)
MRACYVDEAGGFEDPDSNPTATPAMVTLGLVVDAAKVPALTRDFLALKRTHFPGRFTRGPALDHMLIEIKGSELLQMTRSDSRNKRRQADRFRLDLLDLAEHYGCKIVGRVWIKETNRTLAARASYCFAIQDIATHFNQALVADGDIGVVIADGRQHRTNIEVAHSIFTQKARVGGDAYPAIREVPLFAASDNHAGLQIADLLASTLVLPMGIAGFCPLRPANVHFTPRYTAVRTGFGDRLKHLQYRYRDEAGWRKGGLVVSDPVGKQSGSRLFGA